MSERRQIFGTEVTVETIRASIVAIGDGYTVTVQVVLDEDDVLVAHTVARASATFEEATDEMVPEAVQWTSEWMADHAEAAGS